MAKRPINSPYRKVSDVDFLSHHEDGVVASAAIDIASAILELRDEIAELKELIREINRG